MRTDSDIDLSQNLETVNTEFVRRRLLAWTKAAEAAVQLDEARTNFEAAVKAAIEGNPDLGEPLTPIPVIAFQPTSAPTSLTSPSKGTHVIAEAVKEYTAKPARRQKLGREDWKDRVLQLLTAIEQPMATRELAAIINSSDYQQQFGPTNKLDGRKLQGVLLAELNRAGTDLMLKYGKWWLHSRNHHRVKK